MGGLDSSMRCFDGNAEDGSPESDTHRSRGVMPRIDPT